MISVYHKARLDTARILLIRDTAILTLRSFILLQIVLTTLTKGYTYFRNLSKNALKHYLLLFNMRVQILEFAFKPLENGCNTESSTTIV